MIDKSIQNSKNEGHNEGVAFINNCVKEVCGNNDELAKYKKIISKYFPDEPDIYTKLEDFIAKVNNLKLQEKLTNTSISNIKFLAKDLYIEEQTLDEILKPSMIIEPEPPKDYTLIKIWTVIILVIAAGIGCYYAFNQDQYPSYYYDDFEEDNSITTEVDSIVDVVDESADEIEKEEL